MRKMLRTSDKILLTLALFGDAVIETIQRGAGTRNRDIFGFAELSPKEENKLRKKVQRLFRVGDIKKEVRGGQVFISLSPPGRGKLPSRRFSLSKFRNSWDGKWVVVSYDVPEKNKDTRMYLREKLISLGFAKWQRSIYISPFSCFRADIKEWLAEHYLEEYVNVSIAEDLSGGDDKGLAWKIFNLSVLANEYRDILEDGASKVVSPEHFCQRFIETLLHDPYLPKQLLPSDWPGFRAEKRVKDILCVHGNLSIDRLLLTNQES